MSSKPIQQGFKFHCLAGHGYIWDFHPTSNQTGPDPAPPIEGPTATGAVVYHLLQKLPRSRYWIVYLDNFYTSVLCSVGCAMISRLVAVVQLDPPRLSFPLNLKFQSLILKSMIAMHLRLQWLKIVYFKKRLVHTCGLTMHQSPS